MGRTAFWCYIVGRFLCEQILQCDGFLDAAAVFVVVESECGNKGEVDVPFVFG